ncbi:hypothetical protein AB656_06785 [Bifidobacterium actinocoloniiforme DSM 22766]|nr:FHA domain-containing protein [Bifidobacterium actinocoloniiforme]AKV56212.1 hypothetical protein AB656_06785 [Bifidobacterium actinocoloniiforme DSM 22766]
MRQWAVTINGVEKIRLSPGQSIEIGRKPLRPLPDDGMVRLEVQDKTKSMSKRHASFMVGDDGSASLRDLGSTNGSYVVQDDGDLIRVPEDSDYTLQHSAERFQFGDVLVDFAQIADPAPEQQEEGQAPAGSQVPDLFSYAQDESRNSQMPDESNLSVDDILDLRAGEPTGIFQAEGARSRIDALHDQAVSQRQQPAQEQGHQAQPVQAQPEEAPVEESEPESRYVDASAQAEPAESDELRFQPLGAAQLNQERQERESQAADQQQAAAADGTEEGQAYKPAFEPGSVFEKVSRGDFPQDDQVVEVDGMTSDDAKNSTDFSLQFEMAKHTQLLPFLAMNPSLYDDLYAWLSAQGDEDIDAALEKNEGYREYLAATQE